MNDVQRNVNNHLFQTTINMICSCTVSVILYRCLSVIAQLYAWTKEYITLAIKHCIALHLSQYYFKQSIVHFLLSPHVMITVSTIHKKIRS